MAEGRRSAGPPGPFGPGPGRGFHGMFEPPGVRPGDARGTLVRLWRRLARYWPALAVVGVLVAGSSAMSLAGPYLTSVVIDDCIKPGRLDLLARTVGLLLGLYIVGTASGWAQAVLMIRISQATLRDLRADVFARLQILPLRYFDMRPHGELMSRITNDTEAVNSALAGTVTQLLASAITLVGGLAMMLRLNLRLTVVSLVTIPLSFLLARAIARASRRWFLARQEHLGALNGLIEETITGQRVVKVYGREQATLETFGVANAALRRSATMAGIISGMMGPSMNLSRNVTFAVLAASGAWFVLHDQATVGLVAAFMGYSQSISMPIAHIAGLWGTVQAALAGAERVFAVLDEQPEPPDAEGATPLGAVGGEVEFEDVTFGYDPERPVLREVSFHAPAGATVALVGPTGAGKTTITNLLTRFYDVDSGAIRLDGRDVRGVPRAELRRAIGVVLQDTFLFAASVRENIRYGRLEATDAEVEEAARLANAAGFIRRLPHGFETVLGEAGGGLSQGQRQLIAIARAVLADPAVLVLDEATSSVDTRTELHIQEALLRLLEGRTAFVVAHRLSTIRQADRILVIEDGRIVETGTHAELMAAEGAYRRFHDLQFGAVSATG